MLVYGAAAAGFGEEGGLFGCCSSGHPQVHILDGGFAAWQRAKSVEQGPGRRQPSQGIRGAAATRAAGGQGQVQRALSAPTEERPILVDARSEAEWAGANPYLEARGGHIPGARSLPWGAASDAESGQLKPTAQPGELSAQGLGEPSADREIIVYCHRRRALAFVVAVLAQLGYRRVRNYDGSFWEWAADSACPSRAVKTSGGRGGAAGTARALAKRAVMPTGRAGRRCSPAPGLGGSLARSC